MSSSTESGFVAFFGYPQHGTGKSLRELSLERFEFLLSFIRMTGSGVFRDGMLSVASKREQVADLEEWRGMLPPGACHFATSGLSDLFLVDDDERIFWVDTQRALLARLNVRSTRFFDWISEPRQRQMYLAEQLWDARCAELAPDEVLGFVPALGLGGPVDWGNLEKVKVREHLSLLAQIHFG